MKTLNKFRWIAATPFLIIAFLGLLFSFMITADDYDQSLVEWFEKHIGPSNV